MAAEMALRAGGVILIPGALGLITLGYIAALVTIRRPNRRCAHCDTTLSMACIDLAACNRRREARELERIGN